MFFNFIRRFRNARGYGVHSPFAFGFITGVVNSKHRYYAFDDLDRVLMEHNIELYDYGFHHLTYKLIQHFKPLRVLDAGSADGVNVLYICHSSKDIVCHFYQNNDESITLAKNLLNDIDREATFVDDYALKVTYDAIFADITRGDIELSRILDCASDRSFLLINGIRTKKGRGMWKSIKRDNRVSITFDKRNIGIVVLNDSYKKQNYFI